MLYDKIFLSVVSVFPISTTLRLKKKIEKIPFTHMVQLFHAEIKVNYVSKRGPWYCRRYFHIHILGIFVGGCFDSNGTAVGFMWFKYFMLPVQDTVMALIKTNKDITVTSAPRLFTQPFIQVQIKENIKAPRHWPLCGEFTGDRWIPHTNGQ